MSENAPMCSNIIAVNDYLAICGWGRGNPGVPILAKVVLRTRAEAAIASACARVAGLEAESERLKCCGNCATFRMWPDYFPRCDVLNREFNAEDVGDRWPDPSGKCVCPGQSRWAERGTP